MTLLRKYVRNQLVLEHDDSSDQSLVHNDHQNIHLYPIYYLLKKFNKMFNQRL